jgi:hypothetical protein
MSCYTLTPEVMDMAVYKAHKGIEGFMRHRGDVVKIDTAPPLVSPSPFPQGEGMNKTDHLKLIERCLDDAGRQVDALNEIGSAGNVRAVTVASVFIGCATAIVAGAMGLRSASVLSPELALTATVAAAQFYLSAIACLWATLPAGAYIAGSPPEWWKHHVQQGFKFTYLEALENQVLEYERKIAFMRKLNAKNHRIFHWAAVIGAATPVVAAFSYFFLGPCLF